MILFQIGAAPVIPEVSVGLIGLLSLLPTHTDTTKDGVYPIVQLSLLLSEVPVFTETLCLDVFKGELCPNAMARALLSLKTSEMIKATPGSKTSFLGIVFFCSSTFPRESVIF